MKEAPIPANEKERLEAVNQLELLYTDSEERFDRITRIATEIFDVPISTVTLVDSNKEWFKSCQGLKNREGDRAVSFCGHAMVEPDMLLIPDTKKDPRFKDNPMVVGKPYIRFYAGVPIKDAAGTPVGTFCIKDKRPRRISKEQIQLLKDLAKWTEREMNMHEVDVALQARRDAYNALAVTKERYDYMLENSSDIVHVTDREHKVVLVNPAGAKLFGSNPEQLIGRSLKELFPKDVAEEYVQKLEEVFSSKQPTLSEANMPIDGQEYWINTALSPVTDAQGEVHEVMGITRDISEQKRAAQLQQEFISLVSHQMKTPLTGLRWHVELLRRDAEKNLTAEQKRVLDDMYTLFKRLVSLVNNMLNVSRVDSNTLAIQPTKQSIDVVMKEMMEDCHAQNEKLAARISYQREKGVASFPMDKTIFREVIQSFIDNAAQYSKKDSPIHIRVQKNKNRIVFSVRDQGMGMTKEAQKHVFQKFYRSDQAKKQYVRGTGLGLYLTKKFVELSGGVIWFESTYRKGTTFFVSWPISGMVRHIGDKNVADRIS